MKGVSLPIRSEIRRPAALKSRVNPWTAGVPFAAAAASTASISRRSFR
jgi:hypothetical protein